MPTPIFVCGAECGLAAIGTISAGVEHWSGVTATAPTVVTSGPASMRSTRAFRFNPSAATCFFTHTFATAIGSPATTVMRFYIYFTTLPGADTFLAIDTSGNGVAFIKSDNSIRATIQNGATNGASGVVITTGQWYRIDCKAVNGATFTSDVQVDGTACAQASQAGAAGSNPTIRFGAINSATADFYIDDLIVSGTSGDYPIGAGTIVGQYPSADGTHGGGWATGTFGKGTSGATNASNTDTDIWQSLDNPLTQTAAGAWVSNLTAVATTNYVEFRNGTMPTNASTINGAMLVVASHSASATANNFNFDINDGSGHTATLFSIVDLSETTITTPIVVRNTDANGVAWTKTTMDANRNRFSGTDSNPDCYLDGFVWEVDYVAVPPTSMAPLPFARRPAALALQRR